MTQRVQCSLVSKGFANRNRGGSVLWTDGYGSLYLQEGECCILFAMYFLYSPQLSSLSLLALVVAHYLPNLLLHMQTMREGE